LTFLLPEKHFIRFSAFVPSPEAKMAIFFIVCSFLLVLACKGTHAGVRMQDGFGENIEFHIKPLPQIL
jgi:hypothetical protein